MIIQHAVWLYFRFPLSFRDVEDLLAERGIDVSYETVRRWALKFGQAYARKLRTTRPRPDGRWHLDEMFVSINGKRMYLWRAVDSEGEVLDILNDLALLYAGESKYSDAEPLYQRALVIREKTLGLNHPDLATSLENYAALLSETGRRAEADKLDAQAQTIRAKHREDLGETD